MYCTSAWKSTNWLSAYYLSILLQDLSIYHLRNFWNFLVGHKFRIVIYHCTSAYWTLITRGFCYFFFNLFALIRNLVYRAALFGLRGHIILNFNEQKWCIFGDIGVEEQNNMILRNNIKYVGGQWILLGQYFPIRYIFELAVRRFWTSLFLMESMQWRNHHHWFATARGKCMVVWVIAF